MDGEGLAPGTLLDAKFRVVRCLGVGGMGAVYEVQHELTRHRRALKLLHPAFASQREAVERFLREASVAGRIDNPHITETYDAGWLSNGSPYVLMECLEGETLGQRIEREGPLPLELLLSVVVQTCRGLEAAHRAGVVHRDLKPDNLFLADRDGATFVKILDFGISKFDDLGAARPTVDGAFMGTPWYMSPEQFLDGKSVDARADLYSLGVIMFESLTGRHPYPADTLAKLATKIMVDEAPPPSSLRTALPLAVDVVIARAMRKDAGERYPSAAAMGEAVEALLPEGQRTLPQGSFWTDAMPAPAEAVPPSPRKPLEASATVVSERAAAELAAVSPRPAPASRWALAVSLLVAAAAVAWFFATRRHAGEAEAPALSATAVTAAPESAAPTAVPEPPPDADTAVPPPIATIVPSIAPAPRRLAPPPAPPPTKPDYATMEEFPE